MMTEGMVVDPRIPSRRIVQKPDRRQNGGCAAQLSARTFCTFPREFSSIGGKGLLTGSHLIPDTVPPIYSCDGRSPTLPASPPRCTRRRAPQSERWSGLHGHAAASTDGHVPQAADRLAPTRARRAAAARNFRSGGTASPVPKYISSGVCPRNAECGSTRLCSST